MNVVESARAFSDALEDARRTGGCIGFVPTMGALHGGHRSLIERAVRECDLAAVSIFVNPLQFDRADDLERYPRQLATDLELCADLGVDVVFAPEVSELYPDWPQPPVTRVTVGPEAAAWEGAERPGHFEGVTTVVAKLFALVGRCRAYFGEKDFQQLVVIRRMVRDLGFPVELVACPTVREPSGLALSSRNGRLDAGQRAAARVLSRALATGARMINEGQRDPAKVSDAVGKVVASEPSALLRYAAVVDAETLSVPELLGTRPVRILVAAEVGGVHLIDNCDPSVFAHEFAAEEPACNVA